MNEIREARGAGETIIEIMIWMKLGIPWSEWNKHQNMHKANEQNNAEEWFGRWSALGGIALMAAESVCDEGENLAANSKTAAEENSTDALQKNIL